MMNVPKVSGKSIGFYALLLAGVSSFILVPAPASAQTRGGVCTVAASTASMNETTGTPQMICDGANWLVWADVLADGSVTFPYPVAFSTVTAVTMPRGTTAQRPAGVNGMFRYNADNNKFEGYQNGSWQDILTGSAVMNMPFDVYAATGEKEIMNYGGTTPTATFMRNIYLDRSMAIGENAGAGLADVNNALDNTFLGYNSGRYVTTSSRSNTFVGSGSGTGVSGTPLTGAGIENTAMGYRAGYVLQGAAAGNTFVGALAGRVSTTGVWNTFLGNYAGYSNTTESYNTFLGFGTGAYATASYNTFVGHYAGNGISGTPLTGSGNVALGDAAAQNIQGTAAANIAIGSNAGFYSLGNTNENIFIGYQAGNGVNGTPLSGVTQNIAIGRAAGYNLQGAAFYNTVLGPYAGENIATGDNNVLIGYYSGNDITTENNNTFVGHQTGRYATAAANTFVGYQAGYGVSGTPLTGTGNAALGYRSGNVLQGAAANNTIMGYGSGDLTTTGTDNVFMGYQAGDINTTGSRNILIGSGVDAPTATTDDYINIGNAIFGDLGDTTSKADNTADLIIDGSLTVTGTITGTSATAPTFPIAVEGVTNIFDLNDGADAGAVRDTFFRHVDNNNIALGRNAGAGLNIANSPENNFFVGSDSGKAVTSGLSNTAIGYNSLTALTSGYGNFAVGYMSGDSITTGYSNILVGNESGAALTTQNANIFVGSAAGRISTGNYSVAIGNESGAGTSTVSIGRWAANNIGTAWNIVAVGDQAGRYATANANTFVGSGAGQGISGTPLTGTGNAVFGYQSGNILQGTAANNTMLGYNTGLVSTTGADNVFLGYQAGDINTTGSRNILIGSGIDAPTATTDDYLNIGNAIFGDLGDTTSKADNTADLIIDGSLTVTGTITGTSATAPTFPMDVDSTPSPITDIFNYGGAANNATFFRNILDDRSFAIGQNAGAALDDDNNALDNILIGYQAGQAVSTGYNNVVLGSSSAEALTTGYSNTVIGHDALKTNTWGHSNVAIGEGALQDGEGLTGTIAIGRLAGQKYAHTSGSVFIGNVAGANVTGQGNTVIGGGAARYVTTGAYNTFIGNSSGAGVNGTPLTGERNTAVGYHSGLVLQAASYHNNLFGAFAGQGITTGDRNILFGTRTGESLITETDNIMIGDETGRYVTATGNTFVGSYAGRSVSGTPLTGTGNVALGYQSGYVLQGAAANNTLFGYNSGVATTTGTDNVFMGYQTADNNTTGSRNIIIGSNIDNLTATTNDYINIGGVLTGDMLTGNLAFVGTAALALQSGTTAQRPVTGVNGMIRYNSDNNKFEGYQNGSWQDILTGSATGVSLPLDVYAATGVKEIMNYGGGTPTSTFMRNVYADRSFAIGQNAGAALVDANDGQDNILIGVSAGAAITTSDWNIAIGNNAGMALTTQGSNVMIGHWAGERSTGTGNMFLGASAGYDADSSNNVFVGNNIATSNWGGYPALTGGYNTVMGNAAGNQLQGAAASNTFIGRSAGEYNATTSNNTFMGYYAGRYATAAANTFIGTQAGTGVSGTPLTGTGNAAFGYRAGYVLQGAAANNTFTGYQAGDSYTTGSRNIMLGYDIDSPTATATANYELNIGNVIYGTIGASDAEYAALNDGTASLRIDGSVVFGGTGSVTLPAGTVAQRPGAPANGMIRYNSDNGKFEGYQAGSWQDILTGSASAVTLPIDVYAATGEKEIMNYGGATPTATFMRNIAADYSVAIGENAGASLLDANNATENTLMGREAGRYITTGTGNTFMGAGAGQGVSGTPLTGANNVAIGWHSGYVLQGTGGYNTMVGNMSGIGVTTGEKNTLIGGHAGPRITTQGYNVMLGNQAGMYAASANNTFIGYDAGAGSNTNNLTGSGNVAVGYLSGYSIQGAATDNVFVGTNAGAYSSTASQNTFVGDDAGKGVSGTLLTGNGNTALGYQAGYVLQGAAVSNTYIGRNAGQSSTTGSYNTFVGDAAGRMVTTAVDNTFIGEAAGENWVTGDGNVFVGVDTAAIGSGGGNSNIAIGNQAAFNITTGNSNILVGSQAGHSISTQGENVFIGVQSGMNSTSDFNVCIGSGSCTGDGGNKLTGSNNVAVGDFSLNKIAGVSSDNVAVGIYAGANISTGSSNTFIGAYAGLGDAGTPLTGSGNTAIGNSAGEALRGAAQRNTFVGDSAGVADTTGISNTIIGYHAGMTVSTGGENVFIGTNTGRLNTASGNAFVGTYAGEVTSSGADNSFFGTGAGYANTTGAQNTFIGRDTGAGNTTTSDNTFVGRLAGRYATAASNTFVGTQSGTGVSGTPLTGTGNAAFGYQSGYVLQGTANNNTMLGYQAGLAATTGYGNTLVGRAAGSANTTGYHNVVVGDDAAMGDGDNIGVTAVGQGAGRLTTADYGTFVGYKSGVNNSSAQWNAFFGAWAGAQSTTGGFNAFIGERAGASNTIGGNNTFLGYAAGYYSTTSANNTFLGSGAGTGITGTPLTGANNTAVGYHAGYYLQGAAGNNTYLGYQAGNDITTGSNNIIIGYDVDAPTATTSSYLNIGGVLTGDMTTANLAFVGTAALALQSGTTAQRPGTGVNGMIRYNSDNNKFEGYQAGSWQDILTGSATGVSLPLDVYAATGEKEIMNYGGASPTAKFMRNIYLDRSIALGENAGAAMTDVQNGQDNIAIGYNAGTAITTGDYNTILGNYAGLSVTTYSNSTVMGYQAGQYVTSSYNTFVGSGAGTGVSGTPLTGGGHVAMGYRAGYLLQDTAFNNTMIGQQAGTAATTANESTMVGFQAGFKATTSTRNTFLGNFAGYNITNGGYNTMVGYGTGAYATTGGYNTFVGYYAGNGSNTVALTGSGNSSFGTYAGYTIQGAATENTFIGNRAAFSTTTSSYNTMVGTSAGSKTTTGSYNTFIGRLAGDENTITQYNTFVGQEAGRYATADSNTFVGYQSGLGISGTLLTGSGNATLGYQAGRYLQGAAANNTMLGYQAGDLTTTGSRNILIGSGVDAPNATTDDYINLGWTLVGSTGTNQTTAGVGNNANLTLNGDLTVTGVLTAAITPAFPLDVDSTPTAISDIMSYGGAAKDSTFFRNIAGDYSVAIGENAGAVMTEADDGQENTLMGRDAGRYISTADGNTYMGAGAGQGASGAPATVGYNVAIGWHSGYVLQGASGYNTLVGNMSGIALTTGTTNTLIGGHSGGALTTQGYNVMMGNQSGLYVTSANNVLLGFDAGMSSNTNKLTGAGNVAVGYMSGYSMQGASTNNVFVGTSAGAYNSTASQNTFVGYDAGKGVSGTLLTGAENTVLGYRAGYVLQGTANSNTIVGSQSGDAVTTGSDNAFFGQASGSSATTGGNNTYLGSGAGFASTTQSYNTYVGRNAGDFATAASSVAIGYQAGRYFSAAGSTFVGTQAGQSVVGTPITGVGNTALGYQSGLLLQGAAASNTLIGYQAGNSITTGSNNIIIGYDTDTPTATTAAYLNIGGVLTGDMTTANLAFVGTAALALQSGTTAQRPGTGVNGMIRYNSDNNKFEGYQAGSWQDILTGSATGVSLPLDVYNATDVKEVMNFGGTVPTATFMRVFNTTQSMAIGHDAGSTWTTANDGRGNLALGYRAGRNITTGDANLTIGWTAGGAITAGNANTIVGNNSNTAGATTGVTTLGYQAGKDNTADYAMYLGYRAGEAVTTGTNNLFIGAWAGTAAATTTSGGVYIGRGAGNYATGNSNTLIGHASGAAASGSELTGTLNVFLGQETGYVNTSGSNNLFMGYRAGYTNSTGNNNLFLGSRAGYYSTTASDNAYIGYYAGHYATTGNQNTFVGTQAGLGVNGTPLTGAGNALLGYQSGYVLQGAAASNTLIGYQAGNSITTGSNNIIIGYDTDTPTATTAAYLNIGNSIVGTLDVAAPFDAASLTVNGSLTVTGTFSNPSDVMLKKDIADVDTATIEKLLALRPVSFKWKDGRDESNHYGVIAQELQKQFPELVHSGGNGQGAEYLTVEYLGLISPMIATIQSQQQEINTLKSDVHSLEERLQKIEAMLREKQ